MLKINEKYPLIILLILIVLWFLAKQFGLIINVTPSMPRGLYIKKYGEISRDDIVSFCLAPLYQNIGLKMLYLAKGAACNGADALIKKVIAVPGDTVVLQDDFIRVNNTVYPYKTHYRDSIGRKLLAFPRGIYKNITGYWVIGVSDPRSWDSRYWGEVKQTQIIAKLQQVQFRKTFAIFNLLKFKTCSTL